MLREDDDEAVGYKHPPRHSQFKKGQSGNPSGRRKGATKLDLFETLNKVLSQQIVMPSSGKKIPKAEAMMTAVVHQAIKGQTRAFDAVIKLMLLDQRALEGSAESDLEPDPALLARFIKRYAGLEGGGDD